MDEEQEDWLTEQCNMLMGVPCHTSMCMKRGKARHNTFHNVIQPTCIPLEIYNTLNEREETIKDLIEEVEIARWHDANTEE